MNIIRWDTEHTLSAAWQAAVREAGPARYELNRDAGSHYARLHHVEEIEQECDTLGAEVAFCVLAGVKHEHLVMESGWSGIGCVCCYVPDQRGIEREVDVKYRRERPTLIKNENTKHFAAVFPLMLGVFPTYRYRGFSWFEELVNPRNLTTDRYGTPIYALRQSLIKRDFRIPVELPSAP